MNERARLKLAFQLEEQGGKVRRTRDGFMATHPDGGMVSWHQSESKHSNAARILQKSVEKAGFTWPEPKQKGRKR